MLKTSPAVFAVENTYQIMVQVNKPCLFRVKIKDKEYYDESNGIMRSLSDIHRVTVPMSELDEAKEYTVFVRPLIKRRPYFTITAPVREYTFPFKPLPDCDIRAYHISDAHNKVSEPVAAARTFGNIDLLILNGDVISHSGNPAKFSNVYKICSELTKGGIPVIFSRGNHDMRGNYAERFADYTPNAHGNTYYTFRLGGLWGAVLDCGEDKPDSHPEYGFTVSCHGFRERQTEFLKDIISRSDTEYSAEGIFRKVVIVHNPFTQTLEPPFDIEQALFAEWARLLREHIKPDLMICGHTHELTVRLPGSELDHQGQPCPVITGAMPDKNYFAGCGYIFGAKETKVVFTDSNGKFLEEHILDHK